MSTDLRDASQLRWKIQYDALLPSSIKNGDPTDTASSVFDLIIDKYATLCSRAEDMIVRHITVEVENDLKQHLTRYTSSSTDHLCQLTIHRRWDQAASEDREPDASLLNGITALSTHLGELAQTLPILTTSRLYRRIVSHVSNHIQQRAVYAGWSKFSAVGGKDFADEITDWRQASASALPKGMSVDAPWTRLVDISRVLSLPTASRDLPTFSQAMAAAWSDGQEALQAFTQRLGLVDLNRADLQGVLRRRIECWR